LAYFIPFLLQDFNEHFLDERLHFLIFVSKSDQRFSIGLISGDVEAFPVNHEHYIKPIPCYKGCVFRVIILLKQIRVLDP
jgi:hypothetical protein